MKIETLILLVLLLPLVGSAVQAFFGGRIVGKNTASGKRVMGTFAVLFVAIPFAFACIITQQLAAMPAEGRLVIAPFFDWIKLYSLTIPFELRVDTLSMTMTLVITGIGSLIHLYATGYMSEEREYSRFFTYLNLFIAFMLMLVLGNNLALLFIGWEGVGLCSYLLIGFWYKSNENAKAANKAFIVNRIGDWGLTLGLFLILATIAMNLDRIGDVGGRYLSYDVVLSPQVLSIFVDNPGIATAAALLLFVGAMGKSAQFPLYLWLPDAMAGPTPVSALIHAATMVTAGVVLVNRMHPFFELSPMASAVVAITGAFTALFAALVAFGQTDIKKVLAYSTVSQLGFMFIACGVGAYWVGIFHVVTHAFFKALLFLGSGAVIHAMAHEQDMRRYGNLAKYIKITAATMIIGWLAIAGIPPLAGFWSKEAILGNALGNHVAEIAGVNYGYVAGIVALGVALLTAAYMTRMTLLTFFGGVEQWRSLAPSHGHHHDHAHHAGHDHGDHGPDTHGFFYTDAEMAAMHHEHEHHHSLDRDHTPHEVPTSMWFPLVMLAILSLGGGYILHNNELLQHWLYPNGLTFLPHEATHGHPATGWFAQGQNLMIAGIGAGVLGIIYGFLVYWRGLPKREGDEKNWSPIRRWFGQQMGYDKAMMDASISGGSVIGEFTWKAIDAGTVDGVVNGAAGVVGLIGNALRKVQTGLVRSYALMMLVGGAAFFGYLAWLLFKTGGAN